MPRLAALWDTAELPILARTGEKPSRVDWAKRRAQVARVVRRLPLLALMALPYLLGWAARWIVRGLFRIVWALGWTASWLFYTAQEGWYAGAGRGGG